MQRKASEDKPAYVWEPRPNSFLSPRRLALWLNVKYAGKSWALGRESYSVLSKLENALHLLQAGEAGAHSLSVAGWGAR